MFISDDLDLFLHLSNSSITACIISETLSLITAVSHMTHMMMTVNNINTLFTVLNIPINLKLNK